MNYTPHNVHITECHSNLTSEEQEDITVRTIPITMRASLGSPERALLEAWTTFYCEALDNGQITQEFVFTFVDETTAEVTLKPNHIPEHEVDMFGEVFTLRLEV